MLRVDGTCLLVIENLTYTPNGRLLHLTSVREWANNMMGTDQDPLNNKRYCQCCHDHPPRRDAVATYHIYKRGIEGYNMAPEGMIRRESYNTLHPQHCE